MKEKIKGFIEKYVDEYQKRDGTATCYGSPLVGFADAYHPYIQSLRQLIGPSHELPQDVLPGAKSIIAYYIPFTKELAASNREGRLASPEWARAYEETNALFTELNAALIDFIRMNSGLAEIAPGAGAFDREKLISGWSQRHIAYAAGLGTFGINNMLLTEQGCCGRFSTVITDLVLAIDAPAGEEYCLYKKNGNCGVCVKHCPTGALTADGFDRFKCYEICLENAGIYTEFGSSYTDGAETEEGCIGSEVCGKCITGSPCAFW